MIDMAAPRRANQGAPKRTQAPMAQPTAQAASPYQGGLSSTTPQPLAPIVTVGPKCSKTESRHADVETLSGRDDGNRVPRNMGGNL